jgi:hypothetical protein
VRQFVAEPAGTEARPGWVLSGAGRLADGREFRLPPLPRFFQALGYDNGFVWRPADLALTLSGSVPATGEYGPHLGPQGEAALPHVRR